MIQRQDTSPKTEILAELFDLSTSTNDLNNKSDAITNKIVKERLKLDH